jgi:hypothetical protein
MMTRIIALALILLAAAPVAAGNSPTYLGYRAVLWDYNTTFTNKSDGRVAFAVYTDGVTVDAPAKPTLKEGETVTVYYVSGTGSYRLCINAGSPGNGDALGLCYRVVVDG